MARILLESQMSAYFKIALKQGYAENVARVALARNDPIARQNISNLHNARFLCTFNCALLAITTIGTMFSLFPTILSATLFIGGSLALSYSVSRLAKTTAKIYHDHYGEYLQEELMEAVQNTIAEWRRLQQYQRV